MPDEREVAKVAVSPEWRTSINYAILTLLHLVACGFVTFLLLLLLPKASQPPIERDPSPIPVPHEENRDARVVRIWATAMGLLSTVLALFQYLVGISILSEVSRLYMLTSPTISPAANRSNMAKKACRIAQYTNDVHSDTRIIRFRILTHGQAWRKLDCLDSLSY